MSKREKVAYVLAEGIVCDDCITEEERARSDTRIVEGGPAGPVPDEVDICTRCKKII
jgi:hypothetical protein